MARSRGRRHSTGGVSKIQVVALALLAVVAVALAGFALTSNRAPADASTRAVTPVPSPSETAVAPRVAFLGDSYTVGARVNAPQRWSTLVANHFGWDEENFGIADTGYADVGSEANGNLFLDRIAQIAQMKPSIVIVSGGRNDIGKPQAEIAQKVAATYQQIRAALPDAEIVAVSPFWGDTAYPGSLTYIAGQVRQSAEAVGGRYVDVGQPIAGHPEWMHADTVHPIAPGYAALAQAFIAAYSAP